MGFSLKRLGKKIGKAAGKVGKAVGKVGKVAVQLAASQAVPIVQARMAGALLGKVDKALNYRDRTRAKAQKVKDLGKALTVSLAKPKLQMMSSHETSGASARPGGAPVRSPSKKSSASAMPGGAPLRPLGKSVSQGVKRALFSRDMVMARERIGMDEDALRAKAAKKAATVSKAAEKKALAAAKKAEKAQAAAEKKAAAAAARAEKAAAKKGTFLENVGSAFVGAKLTGRGTQGARMTKKAASVLKSQIGKAAGQAARLAKAGKAVPVRTAALAALRGPTGAALGLTAAGMVAAKKYYDKELQKAANKGFAIKGVKRTTSGG